ncbi:2-aminoethylphosphonate ABC transporter permease subunit [Acidiphilium sp. AL]|uniref:2-aminoethylphosphonate ABC transporter permease subunit n=1 Tax=Acidiphilium iwatense TaxID=768198 RepID=A0ABS9E1I6_9PROT|nr:MULTISPECIES: 2-aminoethylphosphonate ABC transporter permease subunit [Acidiphilium]MCF3948213.1 2-aminoethylphosphonate ABC transporter permease subunit [Acidiphilium iwatense]MCU4161670.1 2-aminoethylphosphonate ABC transporter permease subunit [Acidiphilium sp. AL]
MTSIAAPAIRRTSFNTGWQWVLPPLFFLSVLFFYPLALIVRESLLGHGRSLSLSHYDAVFTSGLFQDALLHTIVIALAASAGCLVLGFVLALVLSFVAFPGARLLARLIDTFIALPTFLVALSFTFIYGSAGILNISLMHLLHVRLPPVDFLYSAWGVILAEVTVYTPFVLRPLLASFSLIEPAQIEIANSLGAGPWRIIRQVILPAAIPALLAGGSLCLLLTTNEFGIVLFISAKGVITLPLLVYDQAVQEFDYTTACVIAAANIGLSLTLYSLYRMIITRFGGFRAGLV